MILTKSLTCFDLETHVTGKLGEGVWLETVRFTFVRAS
jgi:hypothetical protein